MKPIKPFILEDGKRYLHPRAAAKIVNISNGTMWRWAAANVTTFGMELDVVSHRTENHSNGHPPPKRHPFRLLIPEEKVMLLKRLLHDFPLNRTGFPSEFEVDTLRRAMRLYSASPAIVDPHA